MKITIYTMHKKTCKPAMLRRLWLASRRSLSLHHTPAHHFGCCQWQTGPRPPIGYLVYRWLLFLAVVSIAIASFACQSLPKNYEGPRVELNYYKWFIYFTNWGYMLIGVQSALALANAHRFRVQRTLEFANDEEESSMRRTRAPLLCRAYWLAHSVATDLAFVITLIYWTLVHDPEIHEVNALNVLVHAGNSLVMVVELAVTAHPVRAAHALYSAGAGLAYGCFSAFYWAVGGTDRLGHPAIYPSLDWNKPGSALGFVTLCAVVMICAHAMATGAAAARTRLAARCRPAHARCDLFTLPTH